MIAVINDFDAELFLYNNIAYARNFIAKKSGEIVQVINAYDSRFVLFQAHYSGVQVNGTNYDDIESLISVLSPILFIKEISETEVAGEAQNITSNVFFNNIYGGWINSPSSPITTNTITFNLTAAKNGGVVQVYYKGNVLTKDSFNGGTVISFSGSNRVDVLCFIWISYDKGNNCFHVNIQDSYTEDIPSGNIENAPTNLVLTLEDGAETIENPPTGLTLTEEESAAAVENAPTNLVLTEEEI